MAKKKVPPPLAIRYETVPKPDVVSPPNPVEPSSEGEVDVNAVAESLIVRLNLTDFFRINVYKP
jgi:hypothetical protein